MVETCGIKKKSVIFIEEIGFRIKGKIKHKLLYYVVAV